MCFQRYKASPTVLKVQSVRPRLFTTPFAERRTLYPEMWESVEFAELPSVLSGGRRNFSEFLPPNSDPHTQKRLLNLAFLSVSPGKYRAKAPKPRNLANPLFLGSAKINLVNSGGRRVRVRIRQLTLSTKTHVVFAPSARTKTPKPVEGRGHLHLYQNLASSSRCFKQCL